MQKRQREDNEEVRSVRRRLEERDGATPLGSLDSNLRFARRSQLDRLHLSLFL